MIILAGSYDSVNGFASSSLLVRFSPSLKKKTHEAIKFAWFLILNFQNKYKLAQNSVIQEHAYIYIYIVLKKTISQRRQAIFGQL